MAVLSATLLRYITHQAAASTPDAVLLQRFVTDRDGDAFAGLVRRHGPIVYRVCRRLVGPSAAEDAFQATFLVLATRAASVRKAGSVGSWLVGVAGRVARQMRKSERRRAVREFAAATVLNPAHEIDQLVATENAGILDDELTRLSDRLRGPVVACLLQGRTYEQAACELGGSRPHGPPAGGRSKARSPRSVGAAWHRANRGRGSDCRHKCVGRGRPGWTRFADGEAVSGFLAGRATIPAALIAKGVATTMTTSVRMVTVLVATAAAGLTALGVGLAGNGKQETPLPLVPAMVALPAARPAPQAAVAGPTDPLNVPKQPPSAGVLRAVEHEAVFLREEIGRRWFGRDWRPDDSRKFDVYGAVVNQPVMPPPPKAVRIMYWRGGPPGSATRSEFEFDGGQQRRLTRAWIDLSGDLDDVIDNQLPREMAHLLMADYFQRPIPRWVEEGMAVAEESPTVQFRADRQCRTALEQGRCLRLSALFELREPPKAGDQVSAQDYSVVRFLWRQASRHQEYSVIAGDEQHPELRVPKREVAILSYAKMGMEAGWDKAVKEWYSFDNVAALEATWIEWMKTEDSRIKPPDPNNFRAVPAARRLPRR